MGKTNGNLPPEALHSPASSKIITNLAVQKISGKKNIWVLAPLFGTLLFIFTYVIAAFLYPGGSQADQSAKGFSWLHNYWCNLLSAKAMNGQLNTGRPFAIAGMFILCSSLAAFWYQFPRLVKFGKRSQKIVQFSGILSMFAGYILFTRYDGIIITHDMIINITGLLAALPIAGTLKGLYKIGWQKLFGLGIFNMALAGINNIIYYSNELIAWLPLIQKITFLTMLVWISLIDIGLYNLSRKS